MKRNVLIMAVFAIVGITSINAANGSVFKDGDFEFTVISESDKTVSLTKYLGLNEDVIIPDRVTWNETLYEVQTIGKKAFAESTDSDEDEYTFDYVYSKSNHLIESVRIPNTITTIGNSAFEYCQNLQNVVIPNSVFTCGDTSFRMLTNVNNFIIGRNVERIYDAIAGAKCNNLYLLPATPPKTSWGAFMDSGVKEIYFNEGSYDSYRNYSIIPSSEVGREDRELWEMSNWTYLMDSRTIKHTSISSPILIPSVTNLEIHVGSTRKLWYYFINNEGEEITPASATWASTISDLTINQDGEVQCSSPGEGVITITITDSDGTIYSTEISVIVLLPRIKDHDFIYDVIDEEEHTLRLVKYRGEGGNVVIPTSVVYNGEEYSVTEIGSNAFEEKSDDAIHKVSGVKIPSTVESIGIGAFRNCKKMTIAYIPENTKTLSMEAFFDSSVNTVVIGKDVNRIGRCAINTNVANWYCLPIYPPITTPYTFRYTTVDNFYVNESSKAIYKMVWPVDSDGKPSDRESGRWASIMGNTKPLPERILIPCNTTLSAVPETQIPLWFDLIDKNGNAVSVASHEWSLLNGRGTVEDDTLILQEGSDVLKLTVTDADGSTYNATIPVTADMSGVDSIFDDYTDYGNASDISTAIYTLQGVNVGTTLENLPAGIYLKKNGARTEKVLVR